VSTARHRRPPRSPLVFILVVAALAIGVAAVLILRPSFGSKPIAGASPSGRHSPPSTSSTTTPPGSATETPSPSSAPRGRLVIHGAGDTNVEPSYIGVSSSNYDYMLSGMKSLFRRDDLTVVNLECAVTRGGTAVPKTFSFRGDPAALPYLKDGGVDVANMANNHSYDYGPDGLVDTRRNIERAGMAAVGAGKDAARAEAPAIFHIRGWTVAVVGIDEVVDPYPEELATANKPGTACGHDVDCMVRQVQRAAAVSDLVVVDIHWGVELDTEPRDYQVEQAKRFVAAGADVIFGGHSHRLQPLSFIHGKPVFWSLGNFVWPHFSEEGSHTAVARVVVLPNGTIKARLLPAYIVTSGHPVLTG
jgi:poly-gamma-glutamate capsule biosynthesis protein CapA/YwtB (metallophosphatase superfamily)